MRYYEQRYPEVDELVMVQVRQIAEMGAYVKLVCPSSRGPLLSLLLGLHTLLPERTSETCLLTDRPQVARV